MDMDQNFQQDRPQLSISGSIIKSAISQAWPNSVQRLMGTVAEIAPGWTDWEYRTWASCHLKIHALIGHATSTCYFHISYMLLGNVIWGTVAEIALGWTDWEYCTWASCCDRACYLGLPFGDTTWACHLIYFTQIFVWAFYTYHLDIPNGWSRIQWNNYWNCGIRYIT